MQDKKNSILIVNTDPQLQKLMSIVLDPALFKITECASGKEAIRLSVSINPDLVLLALTLPDISGQEVIIAIRELSQVPIIVLTTNVNDSEVVTALNSGANDYITRPFNSEVLVARVYAALRKFAVGETGVPEISNGPLRMDLVRHQVYMNGELLGFTPKEYDLLRYFIVNRGRMLTHKEILKEVWGNAHGEDTQYLRVFIGQIRAKIEAFPSVPALIVTEPGVGYRMELVEIAAMKQATELRA